MPGTCEVVSERRWMISLALWLRWANGLSVICMRPVLSVGLAPSTPMKEARWSTSGSFNIASASAC